MHVGLHIPVDSVRFGRFVLPVMQPVLSRVPAAACGILNRIYPQIPVKMRFLGAFCVVGAKMLTVLSTCCAQCAKLFRFGMAETFRKCGFAHILCGSSGEYRMRRCKYAAKPPYLSAAGLIEINCFT